jgi:lipoprotein Spr
MDSPQFLLAFAICFFAVGCLAATPLFTFAPHGSAKYKSSDSTHSTRHYDAGMISDIEEEDESVDMTNDIPINTDSLRAALAYLTPTKKTEKEKTAARNRETIMLKIVDYLDTPYKYGGVTRKGIDCSAFTGTVYRESLGIQIPRSAAEQMKVGTTIDRGDLQFGDLIFFKTRRRRKGASHVGIYIGQNLFAHSSRSHGVAITTLEDSYYSQRYLGARRIVEDGMIQDEEEK